MSKLNTWKSCSNFKSWKSYGLIGYNLYLIHEFGLNDVLIATENTKVTRIINSGACNWGNKMGKTYFHLHLTHINYKAFYRPWNKQKKNCALIFMWQIWDGKGAI